jgi:hypothetical protein
MKHLFRYINDTGRFNGNYGNLVLPEMEMGRRGGKG